jgi:rod shape-determining protein MreD
VKKQKLFLVMISCGALQVTLLDSFKVLGVKPDLLLACVVIASLTFDLKWALIFSVSAGFFKDIFAAQMFGINTLLFPLWSILIIRINREISFDNDYLRLALVFVVTLAQNVVTGFTLLYLGNFVPLGIFIRIVIIEALYTTACLPLLLMSMKPPNTRSSP